MADLAKERELVQATIGAVEPISDELTPEKWSYSRHRQPRGPRVKPQWVGITTLPIS
jgi:hypothetical protein